MMSEEAGAAGSSTFRPSLVFHLDLFDVDLCLDSALPAIIAYQIGGGGPVYRKRQRSWLVSAVWPHRPSLVSTVHCPQCPLPHLDILSREGICIHIDTGRSYERCTEQALRRTGSRRRHTHLRCRAMSKHLDTASFISRWPITTP
jgi:hypothetical protein